MSESATDTTADIEPTTLGAAIRAARDGYGISRSKLSHVLNCGEESIKRWERGDNAPSFATVVAIARVTGASLEDLAQTIDLSYIFEPGARIELATSSLQEKCSTNSAIPGQRALPFLHAVPPICPDDLGQEAAILPFRRAITQ